MEIVTPFITNKYSKEFEKHGGFHSGVSVAGKQVRALAGGTVILVGREPNKTKIGNTVIISYNEAEAFSYANMDEVNVGIGDSVTKNQIIGTAKDTARVEYLHKDGELKTWPVRVGMETWYKQDPTEIVEGTKIVDSSDAWYRNINLKPSTEFNGDDDRDAADKGGRLRYGEVT